MFSNIPTSSDRHTLCSACIQPNDLQRRKDLAKSHYSKILLIWATSSNPQNKVTGENHVSIPVIDLIDTETYNSWKTDFENKGYVVTNDGKHFVVSIA